MRAFLKGVKPEKGMSFDALEKSMGSMKGMAAYKQVLANIGASSLSVDEKIKLRSFLSASLLGAMKDPEKFKSFTPEFIEHIMFGGTIEEIKEEFPKAARRDMARVDKKIKR